MLDKVMHSIQRIAMTIGILMTGILIAMALSGCMAARGPAGEIVIGMEVGRLVETTNQAILTGAGMIPGVGPFLQNMLIGAGASGLTVAGAMKGGRAMLEKRRKAADIAREVAERRVAELEAEKAARDSSA